jgi:cysteine desulfurase
MAHIDEENTRVRALRDRLEQGLLAAIPNSQVNGDTEHRLPNTSSVAFKFVEGEAILLMLDQYGICASSGSACTSGSLEPSHVLRAMGVPFTFAHGSIRFSLSRYTTDADIDLVLDKLPGIIETLRRMSPFRDDHPQAAPVPARARGGRSTLPAERSRRGGASPGRRRPSMRRQNARCQ